MPTNQDDPKRWKIQQGVKATHNGKGTPSPCPRSPPTIYPVVGRFEGAGSRTGPGVRRGGDENA